MTKVIPVSREYLMRAYIQHEIASNIALVIHNPLINDQALYNVITATASELEIELEIKLEDLTTQKIIVPIETQEIGHKFCSVIMIKSKKMQNISQVECDLWVEGKKISCS